MIRQTIRTLAFALSLLLLASCGSRQFTKGEYDDLEEARLLDDKFNETDMRMIADSIAEKIVGSQVARSSGKPPVVLVTLVSNRTQEHVDMKSLTDKIRVTLVGSGKFRSASKRMRGELAKELDYQAGKYVDPKTARKIGKQVGAEYFLAGELTDRVQEVGKKKYVYYKATFELVNIETGLSDWIGEKELRKFYKKRSVSF